MRALESVAAAQSLGYGRHTKSFALQKRKGRAPNVKTETARQNLNSAWTYGSSINSVGKTRCDTMAKRRLGHPATTSIFIEDNPNGAVPAKLRIARVAGTSLACLFRVNVTH